MKYTFADRIKRTLNYWHWREQGLALAITVFAFVMLGPFGTSALPLGWRAVYWLTCISVGWLSVLLLNILFLRHPDLDEWPLGLRTIAAVSLSSIPIGLAVWQVEKQIRHHQIGFMAIFDIFFVCALIGGLVYMRISTRIGVTQAVETPGPVPFLKRLPFDLGQKIISLTTQDHYVEVTTVKGATLVLTRFQDAIEELGAYGGLRIHRSHWVAMDAVRGMSRLDGKQVVELIDGRFLPVNRTYARAVRALFA